MATDRLRQELLREVNDRIAEVGSEYPELPVAFLCECSDPACSERVELSPAEYEVAKATGPILVPGHKP